MALYLIEETYELVDAIVSARPEAVCEELGDVLFHVMFMAHLFEESGDFDIETAAERITEKMIRRHPHVFGKDAVAGAEEVKQRWREIKKREKGRQRPVSVLDSIPAKSPALIRAYRISERAAGTGFDWQNVGQVTEKVEEEWDEFKAEVAPIAAQRFQSAVDPRDRVALEFGDILFTLVNVARFLGIHPETALAASTHKFEDRFRHMEQAAAASGRSLETLSFEEMHQLWQQAKEQLEPPPDVNRQGHPARINSMEKRP